MQAALSAQIPGVEADCGGMLSCATCHVVVHEPYASQLPGPDAGWLDGKLAPQTTLTRLMETRHDS